jgi:cell division protein FtsB
MSELWDYTYALIESVRSILVSSETDRALLMKGSLDQFCSTFEAEMYNWLSERKATESVDVKIVEKIQKSLNDLVGQETKVVDDKKDEEGSVEKMAEDIKKNDTPVVEINKSELPENVQKYIDNMESKINKIEPALDKMVEQNKEMSQQIAKMSDDNLTKDYIVKAADFKNLNTTPEEFGVILKSISTLGTETYTKVEKILKAADEAIAKGNLFNQNGSDASTGAAVTKQEAWAQIEALADAMVTKDSKVTRPQAIDAVIKSDEGKKLYNIYNGR